MSATATRKTIEELFNDWENLGRKLLDELDAEHDTHAARIEQLRADIIREKDAMADLRIRRRKICERLGIDPGPERDDVEPVHRRDGSPTPLGVIRKMSQRAQQAVPVEEYRPNRPVGDRPRSNLSLRDEILRIVREQGEIESAEIVDRVLAVQPDRDPVRVRNEIAKMKAVDPTLLASRKLDGSRKHIYFIPKATSAPEAVS